MIKRHLAHPVPLQSMFHFTNYPLRGLLDRRVADTSILIYAILENGIIIECLCGNISTD